MTAHEPFRFEFRPLVGVAEVLADIELILTELPAVRPGHVGGRDIGEVLQAAAVAAQLGELQHSLRAGDVDRARLRER